MIARFPLILVLVAGAARPAVAQQRDTASAEPPASPAPPCKCHAKLVGQCFTVHGSMSVYRRAPTVRITVAGTKRVLALKDGVPDWLEEDLEVPGNVVTGDFLVCPLTRRKAGAIQLVCVESASDMVVTQKP